MHRKPDVLEVVITTSPGKTRFLEEAVRSFLRQGVSPEVFVHTLRHWDAWNECIERAHGKYLALAHHDDVYWPAFCRTSVRYLEENPDAAAVFSLAYFIDAEGRPTGSVAMPLPDKRVYDFEDIFKATVLHRNVLQCPTVVYRTEQVKKVRVSGDLYPAEDKDFFFTLLDRCGPVGVIPKPLVWYRIHGASASNRDNSTAVARSTFVEVLRKWARIRPDVLNDEETRFWLGQLIGAREHILHEI